VNDSLRHRLDSTWDGLPVARDKPYGVSILVRRYVGNDRDWLVLHRKHQGWDHTGEWAWTPPAGARLPEEDVLACATRELREETGLSIPVVATGLGSEKWPLYTAEAPTDAEVRLDAEHDRYEWVSVENAARQCRPAFVGQSFRVVAEWLDS